MTFCIGIKVNEGIVALADTRIVRGHEQSTKQKLFEFKHAERSLFTTTSGLRSVRDKTMTYVEETLHNHATTYDYFYQFANLFGEQLRRVKLEDGPALAATHHSFNLNAIIGGQLSADQEPKLFYVFPEGNWVESTPDTPYFMVGRTYYAKPLLDLLLRKDTSLRSAVTLALLAFEATQTSVTDVGYPVDVMVLPNGGSASSFQRYNETDVKYMTDNWKASLDQTLLNLPMDWASPLFSNPFTGHSS
ncbi:MAG: Proteasome-type protease [uncultured Thiotrichaceae bacterium]|uniref:Proteasome-type protease n=1 Tax=uncultured Thiotrichaceae bacterium TaxID=298394 RepID=A0A6S6SHF2_9GAMM|nr:MAG: Proteasome-type protease [uncultured Thiotrichaceae bacterium]